MGKRFILMIHALAAAGRSTRSAAVVGDVMGGKVLDLPEFRIYDQRKEEGRAEGEEERKALKQENECLRREIELLRAAKAY